MRLNRINGTQPTPEPKARRGRPKAKVEEKEIVEDPEEEAD